MNRWVRHIANALFVVFGLLIIRASVWFFEPKYAELLCSIALFLTGCVLIVAGIIDYFKSACRWYQRRKQIKEEKERRERLRKLLEEEERRREEQRRMTAELMKSIERVVKYPKITMETTGEILKRLRIRRERRRKARIKPKKVLEIRKPKPEGPRYSVLEPLIEEILTKGELYIDRNMHYGRLRGKDIARALVRELKNRNVEYEVKWGDYDALIKIKRG